MLASRIASALGAATLLLACGSPESALPSEESGVATQVAPGARPYRVAVISDLNGRYGSTVYGDPVHAAVDRLVTLSPDLVLSTGDMVAGMHAGVDPDAMWASFHTSVSDRLAAADIPFAVTPGNHDASGYPRWQAERSVFVREWSARRPDVTMVDGSSYPLRYSFVAGPAFFVSLDATTVGPLDDAQMRWLDQQLAHAPRAVTVVFGHLPLHPFAEGREREAIGDTALEALLLRHEVDVFVSGHHHAYYPGRRGRLRLVSTACLGGGPRPLLGTTHRSERSIVVFELDESALSDPEAWGGERFDHRIERSTLPRSVGEGARRIDRDDVAPTSPPSSS